MSSSFSYFLIIFFLPNLSPILASTWAAESTTALCLAGNLRGVHGTGKSECEGFYTTALWMHDCHPATLALNVRPVVEFGYLKDLPELLHRIIHGGVSTWTPGKKARLTAEGGFMVRGRHPFHSSKPRRVEKGHRRISTSEACVVASQEGDRKISAKAAVVMPL